MLPVNNIPVASRKQPPPAGGTLFRSRIASLNLALGGGFRKGEATLVGGPTGGGKTVLACQLAFEFGASGAKVALFSTEHSADELLPRFIANATNTEYGRLLEGSELDYSQVVRSLAADPRTRSSMAQLCAAFDTNTRIVELDLQAYSPMRQILDRELGKLRNDGFVPDVLIYDWLGSNERQGGTDLFKIRRRFKESADSFAACCARNGLAGVVFCQVAMGLVGNKTTSIRSHMVADAKNMMEHMAHFVGISSLHESGRGEETGRLQRHQYFHVESKTGSAQKVPVEQQFEYQRFAGGCEI